MGEKVAEAEGNRPAFVEYDDGPIWRAYQLNGVTIELSIAAKDTWDDLPEEDRSIELRKVIAAAKKFRDDVREGNKPEPIGKGDFGAIFALSESTESGLSFVLKEDGQSNNKDDFMGRWYKLYKMVQADTELSDDIRIMNYFATVSPDGDEPFDHQTHVNYENMPINRYVVGTMVPNSLPLIDLKGIPKPGNLDQYDSVTKDLIAAGEIESTAVGQIVPWANEQFIRFEKEMMKLFERNGKIFSLNDFGPKNILVSIENGKPIFTLVDM